jgi:hypothetical protein
MGCNDNHARPRRFRVRTVRGEPYEIGGRVLTPITRIVTVGKASATIRTDRYGGWGAGLAWAMPVALLEETGEGERRIVIQDATLAVLQRLGLAALAITLFFAVVRRWAGRRQQAHSE